MLDTGCNPKSCVTLDIAELKNYISSLNMTLNSSLNMTDVTVSDELPFGSLASDWSRLLLLQDMQKEGSLLRENLLRLSRLMLAAYFDRDDELDWKNLPPNDYNEYVPILFFSDTKHYCVFNKFLNNKIVYIYRVSFFFLAI